MYKTGLGREAMESVLHLDHAYPRQKMVSVFVYTETELKHHLSKRILKKNSKFNTKHSILLNSLKSMLLGQGRRKTARIYKVLPNEQEKP